MWYGYLTAHRDIFHINLLAVFTSTFYVGVFAFYDADAVNRFTTVLVVTTVVVAALVCDTNISDAKLKIEIFAFSATTLSIILCASPTPQIVTVIRSKSLEGYPTALTVAGFISSCLWAQCSILMHSLPYLVPNLVGVLFNGAQLVVVIWIYARAPPEPPLVSPQTSTATEGIPRLISYRKKADVFGNSDRFTVYGSVFSAAKE